MSTEDLARKLFRKVTVQKDGTPPCPFCCSPDVEAQFQMDDVAWVVACKACGSCGPYTENGGPIFAIEAWSRGLPRPRIGCPAKSADLNAVRRSTGNDRKDWYRVRSAATSSSSTSQGLR